MEVSNASLYDVSSALAEAILMAVRANKHSKTHRILLPTTLHPAYRQVVHAIVKPQDIDLIEIPCATESGHFDPTALKQFEQQDITAIVIAQPNFFGVLEDVDVLTDWAHQKNALVIGVVNPLSLALFKEPGRWGKLGADIVCGEAQPFGIPLASGGPYLGLMCCKQQYVRQMPGRIIGRTVDVDGKQGFTLTLQAREQHIRRGKATSNICTNQGLLVTAATIYMSLLGYAGLQRVAAACHANTVELCKQLTRIKGVAVVFNRPYFHEVVLRLPKSSTAVLAKLADQGIYAGYNLQQVYPELENCILLCATETKTTEDIQQLKHHLEQALQTL
jgi:glycine dehydrogenase subunit 1